MLGGKNDPAALKQKKFLVVGGDDRFVELAKLYRERGSHVSTFGMDNAEIDGVNGFDSMADAVDWADVIIGPVPFAKDGSKINCKYAKEDVLIRDLLCTAVKGKTLMIGAANKAAKELAAEYGISYIDYYSDESYQILNTIPTVEGTIAILINELRRTVFGSRILILGYGRIGKLLSEYLQRMGAEVYVEARKDADLTWIASKRMTGVQLEALADYIERMDIIINTVPALILNQEMLDRVGKHTLLLDLASSPGGIDFRHAAEKGIKAIHALGIPGKMAYRSAAEYILQTIDKLIGI